MLNVDENQAAAQKLGIRGIPAMVVVKNGKEIGRIQQRDRASIARAFQKHL